MVEIVAIDIGGTNARFVLAQIEGDRITLGEPAKFKVEDHDTPESAWSAFADRIGRPLPRAAVIAVASPVGPEEIRLTNSDWVVKPAELKKAFAPDRLLVINDFCAMGHAVARLPADQFRHLSGPDRRLPDKGVISVLGPGTGLGVGQLVHLPHGYHVIDTEGGHAEFAPVDEIDDTILEWLRSQHDRVSIERVVSGPGIVNIYAALAAADGRTVPSEQDDVALWRSALAGDDQLARSALDQFCKCLGTAAGTVALIQGASAVVIAGGVGQRLADYLPSSGFAKRFAAKGRFAEMMANLPIKLITHSEPGLFGAAAAFAAEA